MKILAGIPTRLRSTSGKIADILAQAVDEVLIVSQGAQVNSGSSNVVVHEKDVNFGLVAARNYILSYAVKNNFDFVVQSDDDLSYTPHIIEYMLKEVWDNPTLGAIASSSRAYFNWDKDVECTKNFLLAPCSPQLWVARTSILEEVGEWTLEYLEDREHAARMWKLGYAIGMLHIDISLTHNPFIARTNISAGGQDKSIARKEKLRQAIEYMNKYHSNIVRLKIYEGKSAKRTFSSRYYWNNLLKFPIARFGYALKYEDSRGRIL